MRQRAAREWCRLMEKSFGKAILLLYLCTFAVYVDLVNIFVIAKEICSQCRRVKGMFLGEREAVYFVL